METLDASTLDMPNFPQTLVSLLEKSGLPASSRVTVGISMYSLARDNKNRTAWIRSLSLSIKKLLVEKGMSVRVVLPQKECALTSVQVKKNGLLTQSGCELVLLKDNNHLIIGKTTDVQPFEEYSLRDWNRPAKAHQGGLLPPKIAQMMINLARLNTNDNPTILDPFCGSGTILQEALLMGYSSLIGSDLDTQAVARTQKNIAWLSREKQLSLRGVQLQTKDATALSSLVAPHTIDAIVTEPYLGPLFTRLPDQIKLQSVVREISRLFLSFFREAHRVLKKNSPCIIVLPVWLAKKPLFLPVYDRILSLGFTNATIPPLVSGLITSDRLRHNISSRNGILFYRVGSIVGRELFVFHSR